MQGDYWLTVTDTNGCKWKDTMTVSFKTLPNFNLGADTAICEKDTLVLNATVTGASNYLWNTAATTPQIKAYQQNIYWCDVIKDGCVYRDSLQLTLKPFPVVNLGGDTTLCEGSTLRLNAANAGASFIWQDNSTADNYLVTKDGLYNVIVNKANCIVKDTITIAYQFKPRFALGANQLICQGQTIILQPNINSQWQDGSSLPNYKVTQPGLYSLNASNNCGSTKEEVLFTNGLCQVYIPKAFSPNGDRWNELFRVSGTDLITKFHLQVFNRYGQLVFETQDKNNGWDGRYKGIEQPGGAYIWILGYSTLNKDKLTQLKGNVVLIR